MGGDAIDLTMSDSESGLLLHGHVWRRKRSHLVRLEELGKMVVEGDLIEFIIKDIKKGHAGCERCLPAKVWEGACLAVSIGSRPWALSWFDRLDPDVDSDINPICDNEDTSETSMATQSENAARPAGAPLLPLRSPVEQIQRYFQQP